MSEPKKVQVGVNLRTGEPIIEERTDHYEPVSPKASLAQFWFNPLCYVTTGKVDEV